MYSIHKPGEPVVYVNADSVRREINEDGELCYVFAKGDKTVELSHKNLREDSAYIDNKWETKTERKERKELVKKPKAEKKVEKAEKTDDKVENEASVEPEVEVVPEAIEIDTKVKDEIEVETPVEEETKLSEEDNTPVDDAENEGLAPDTEL